jgi:hypothetical protein
MPHLLPLPIRFTRDADGRTGRSTALTTAIRNGPGHKRLGLLRRLSCPLLLRLHHLHPFICFGLASKY